MSEWSVMTGDCREVLFTRARDLRGAVVITDPPWVSGKDFPGAGLQATSLWNDAAVAMRPARSVIVYQSPHDPIFSPPPQKHFQVCWLRLIPPAYRGNRLLSANIAIVYGEPYLAEGRRIFAPEGQSASRESQRARREARDTHPCPMSLDHARWLVKSYAQGAPLVVDPFCGAGTVGRACAEIGIPFLGVEIDPSFADYSRQVIGDASLQQRIPGTDAVGGLP